MSFRPLIRCLLGVFCAALICTAAAAQNRLAYIIGNGASENGHVTGPATDALAISRTLLGLGFDVIRREDVSPSGLPLGDTAAETVVLFYSGRTIKQDGRTLLMGSQDTGWPLIDTAKAFRRSGAGQVIVFVDTCHTGSNDLARLPSDPDDWRGIFVAFGADHRGRCADASGASFTDRVLAALSTPDTDIHRAFQAAKGAGWTVSNLLEPVILLRSDADKMIISDADLDLLDRLAPADRDRMRALWVKAGFITAAHAQPVAPQNQRTIRTVENDTIRFSNRLEPAQVGTVLAPQVPARNGEGTVTPASLAPSGGTAGSETGGTPSGGIRIINAVPRSQVTAIPTGAGLPRPSVIVGRIQPEDVSFSPTVSGGTLTGTTIETDGFEARETLRVDDARLYTQLVNSGAFDPGTGTGQLETALQIELDRMGCYTSTIDGIWGGNSAAAVDRYYQQIGETPESRDPSIALFRKIVLNKEVACPVVRQAARPAAPATQATTQRAAQPRATRPRAAQPRAAQPRRQQPPAGRQIQLQPNIFGTGIRG